MVRDIGDGDDDVPAVTVRFRKDGVVVITGIVIVDGDERDGAKIAAVFSVARGRLGLGFDENVVRKLEWDTVGSDGGKADGAGILPAAKGPGDANAGRARTPVVDGLRQDKVVVAHGVDVACRNLRGAVFATAGAGDETAAPDVLVDAGYSGRRPGKDAAQPAMASSTARAAPDRDQGKVSHSCRGGPPAAGHVEHDEWRRSASPPLDGARQQMTFFVEVNDFDNDVTPVMVPGTAAHSQVARTDFLAFRGGFRRFFGAAFLRARRSSAISRVTSPGSIPAGSEALVRSCRT